jgi:hypothetical protein
MKITCISHVKIGVKTIRTMGNAKQIVHYTITRPGRFLTRE